MRTCAYIAGDKNIIYPAIVCLLSVKKYNMDIDLFLFSERQFANKEQLKICKEHKINFIDIKEIDTKHRINIFSGFSRWPAHVFYNYMAPDFLYSKGYNYAIKLDYDMICIDSFIMSEILPEKTQGICVLPKRKISAYVDKISLKKLKEKFVLGDYRVGNVGLIVFDLEYFNKNDILNTYIDIFTYVSTNEIYHGDETCEQFCFGLLQGVLNKEFKQLHYAYNFRPYHEKRDIENIKILHYNFKQKPWHPILEDFSNVEKDKYIRFIIATAYWIEYANSLNFTEDWYANKNISLKSLYNTYNKAIHTLDKNDRKTLLENYILFLQEKESITEDITYDRHYRYAQIRMFSEKSIHYELLFKSNGIAICIHFEQAWKKYADYLQNTVCKQISIDMVCPPQRPEIYYLITDVKDIHKICTTTAAIIKQSYNSIANFITIHNIYNSIIKEREEATKLICRRIGIIDEKIKYIYEATVGDKKDNSNFIFNTIYKQKIWAGGTSGSGSNPAILQGYMSFLEKFIRDNKITSIADIGCGDWQYMRLVNLKGVTYTGYDVASPVIEANQQKFSAPNIDFVLYDGNFAEIKAADLAICKDVLQHLPNKNIFNFIENIKKFKYVLVANDIADNMTTNVDIPMGQCRPLDLRLPPFNIAAEPVFIVDRKHLKKANIMVLLIKNK